MKQVKDREATPQVKGEASGSIYQFYTVLLFNKQVDTYLTLWCMAEGPILLVCGFLSSSLGSLVSSPVFWLFSFWAIFERFSVAPYLLRGFLFA